MATLANIGVLGTLATSASFAGVSPSRDVQVGEFVVVLLSERSNGISTMVDNSSQAGSANSYIQDQIRNDSDPFTYIYSSKITRKILSSDTITATFLGSGLCSISVLALPEADSSSQLDKTVDASSGGSSTYTSSAVSSTSKPDEYAVGIAAFAQASTGTPTISADAPWIKHFSAAAGGGYGTSHGWRILTATGTPAFTGTWGVTHDGLQTACIATYLGVPSETAFVSPHRVF